MRPEVLPSPPAIPTLPADFVSRYGVRRRLDRLVAAFPVTLVRAPAGHGRTSLLVDWCVSTGTSDKIWVSLDRDDAGPDRFWTTVLTTVRANAYRRGFGRTGALPADWRDLHGFLAEVVDALAGLPAPTHLVLDDLHEIRDEETLRGIAGLVQYLPDNVRLVLSSRGMPALPLARLRLRDRLAELGVPDLRFSYGDAATLLRRSGVELTDAQVRVLVDRTDGWAAGLRLAARSLRDSTDHDRFLAGFGGTDRALGDYLGSEIIDALPAETTELLRTVSICAEVTPTLAAALTGRRDAGTALARLEREHSLVIGTGTGRKWFRIQPLLRSYLEADLSRLHPNRAIALHAVAAFWFAGHELYSEAFDHAARVPGASVTAELLRRHAVPLLLSGDLRTVRRALVRVGPAVATDSSLALVSSLANVLAGESAAAEADLRHSTQAWPEDPPGRLRTLRGLVTATYTMTFGFSGVAESVDWRDLVRTKEGCLFEAWARLGLGWSLLYEGRRAAARDEIERARRVAADHDFDYLVVHALAALGALSGLSGDYAGMAAVCAESAAMAEKHSGHQSAGLALDHTLLAFARLMRLDPAGALQHVAKATAPIPRHLHYLLDVVRAAIQFDLGAREAGLRLMRNARVDAGDLSLPVEVLACGALMEHRCALELGRDPHAREVVAWTSGIAGAAAEVSLMRARAAFAGGAIAPAEAAVRDALAEPAPLAWPTVHIEAHLLAVALEIRQGGRNRARTALATALKLAEPSSLIRPFHQAHPSVGRLLREQLGGFGPTDEFAARVSRALSDAAGNTGVELTKREQAVLTRLSEQGSLGELAADLAVSVNTVKTHIRAIYAKLGVNNRRAAVVAGRQLGLT